MSTFALLLAMAVPLGGVLAVTVLTVGAQRRLRAQRERAAALLAPSVAPPRSASSDILLLYTTDADPLVMPGGVKLRRYFFEHAFQNWVSPTLDAASFSWATLHTANPAALDRWIRAHADSIRAALSDFYDPSVRFFRTSWASPPSIYSGLEYIHALNFLISYDGSARGYDPRRVVREFLAPFVPVKFEKYRSSVAEDACEFVLRCRNENGGFSETPGAEPGVITSTAALSVLHRLGALQDREGAKRLFRDFLSFAAGECLRISESDGWAAMANLPSSPRGDLVATHAFLRSFHVARKASTTGADFAGPTSSTREFLSFVLHCSGDAGFSISPEDPVTSLCAAHMGLESLLLLLTGESIGVNDEDARGLLGSHYERHLSILLATSRSAGPIGLYEGAPQDVYSIRACARTLEILTRYAAHLGIGQDHRIAEVKRDLAARLLEQHLDHKSGLAVGYATFANLERLLLDEREKPIDTRVASASAG